MYSFEKRLGTARERLGHGVTGKRCPSSSIQATRSTRWAWRGIRTAKASSRPREDIFQERLSERLITQVPPENEFMIAGKPHERKGTAIRFRTRTPEPI
jgi:hypothetical protein